MVKSYLVYCSCLSANFNWANSKWFLSPTLAVLVGLTFTVVFARGFYINLQGPSVD